MENALTILVIILATFLAIFLFLFIIVLIKLLEVLNHLKSISEKAERLADKAENISEIFRYTAGPVAIGKLLANISNVVFKNHKSRSK